MMQNRWIILLAITLSVAPRWAMADEPAEPRRAILLMIDGLHPEALDWIELPNLRMLRDGGTSFEHAELAFPMHPTVGAFGEASTTSLVNPTILTGSVFLRPDGGRMIQEQFAGDRVTAHAAGSTSYRSLNRGFNYAMAERTTDRDVMDFVLWVMERKDPVFLRIMLQETGNASRVDSGKQQEDVPWRQNIFAEGSPYLAAAAEADAQIGRLLDYLRMKNELEHTVIVVLGDGTSRHGWHMTMDPEASRTPLIFFGPGIKAVQRLPYAESIDVAPTIAHLMGVEPPNEDGGSGRVLDQVKVGAATDEQERPRRLKQFNQTIREGLEVEARARLMARDRPEINLLLMELQHEWLSDHQFYGPARVMEWHEAGSIQGLIESNQGFIDALQHAMEGQ